MIVNTLVLSAQENYTDAANLILDYGLKQNKVIKIVNIEDISVNPNSIEGVEPG